MSLAALIGYSGFLSHDDLVLFKILDINYRQSFCVKCRVPVIWPLVVDLSSVNFEHPVPSYFLIVNLPIYS